MNCFINLSPAFLQTRLYKVRQLLLGVSVVSYSVPRVVADPRQVVYAAKSKKNKVFSAFFNTILSLLIFVSIVSGAAVFGPKLYYSFFDSETVKVAAQTEGSPMGGKFESKQEDRIVLEPTQEPRYIPSKNENLPEGDWMIIPRIGVRSILQDTQDSEEALNTGLWRDPNYGKPGDIDMPMIVAGHRYGWKWWWKDDYWKYHSFYLLPDLEPGDTIEVISDQRKWIYEVYAGEEGEEVTDYQADLIIYTCKFLNSPIRHFRYARLIDPTVNTQN